MKNIILIITDTFRYDNLGDKARRPVRTPCLDRHAAGRATAIENFYTGSFPTIPHRTDVATGVVGWPHYGWQPIDVSGPNHIAGLLRAQGYVTQLICDCPHLFNTRFQFAFDAAFQHRGQEGDKYLLRMNEPIRPVVPREKTRLNPLFRGEYPLVDVHRWLNRNFQCEEETFPAKTGATSIRWLEENGAFNPFFLWIDFFDPHEPWDPPEYLVRRYDPDYRGTPMLHANYGPASAYTDEELHNLWAHYAAEAELVDRYIGRVLEKIDDLGLWDDTVVVITSDHGYSIGEHARAGKSNICAEDARFWPIYPEVGHVPFLLAGAGIPKGRRLDLFAQPADILPTVCELAGVQTEPPEPFDGRSFAQAVLDGKSAHRDHVVSGCHVHTKGEAVPKKCVTPFVIAGQWGYAPVGAAGRGELYDLRADPLAETNVAADNPAVCKELHGLLVRHLQEHGASEACVALWQTAAPDAQAEGKWAIDYPEKAL
ncbi:MAG: sulfatase-like hydrolase/transferase [Kiritimatiellae bacterium]|nr:sulfatase-like hydrolase/transferase [Kiritimatiellia bacterium]